MRPRYRQLPTGAQIDSIPLVDVVEFELSDKETARLRAHLYAINKDGIRRFRTLRENNVVLVWRIK